MDKEQIRQLLLEQRAISMKHAPVPRELLKKISGFVNTPFVIIVSGVRRSGKSTLLHELRETMPENYYVNFDDDRFVGFTVHDFQTLYELLIELFGNRDTFFFDEIQNVAAWERFVRRLHDAGKKVYLTGSNASMLSRELGTHLTGRQVSLSLYPFSFREFLLFRNTPLPDLKKLISSEKSEIKRLFNEYVLLGGFPEYLQTGKTEYLKSVYENILYRDIIVRYKLPHEKTIKETVYYAISNIGKEISFNSVRKLTNVSSATTIREYFSYLENSYLVFLISRFHASLKKQIYSPKKIYVVDAALANVLGFRMSEDAGRILENVVFIELKRKNKEIYYHKETHECDFVIKEGIKITGAIQVTRTLAANRNREVDGLMDALKKYNLDKGLILTDDCEEEFILENKKIIIQPVWKWLLEEVEKQ